ncbi:MAG: PAS domain S-box protein, partial [Haloferacaceae archaeon]
VEDDPAFADLTRTYLEREDDQFVVETETDPRAALSAIESDPPDCVVSDYEMPGMNGLELLEAVRAAHPRLPFVLFTGKGTEAIASRAISAGVSEYLQKQTGTDQYAVLATRISNSVERYERERELEQYRTVVETAGDAMCVLDENDRFEVVNAAFERLTGHEREALIGAHVSNVFPASAIEQGRAAATSLLDGGTETTRSESFTVTTEGPDGDRRHYDTTLSLVGSADSGGGTVLSIRDRTDERRKTQFLDGLFEESLDGIGVKEIVTDDDGDPVDYIYRRVNDRFEELTGLDAETVVDKRATDVIDGIEETPFIEIFGDVGLGGEPVRFEQYSEPLERYYDVSAFSPQYGECISIFSDITDRKEREREREESRELLRATEQLAAVGGWNVDVETEELQWTRGTYAVHGLDPEGDFEPTIDDTIECYHPDDRETIERAVSRCMETGEPYDKEVRLHTADDRERWVRTAGEAIREDGEIRAVRGAIRDVTERKERERELQRYEELLEYSPDLIVVLDEEGTVTYQSSPSPLFEWEPRDVEGDSPFDYIHPADREQLLEHFERLRKKPGRIDTVEFRAEDAHGTYQWIESRAQNFVGTDPIDGILTVMRDVNERKQRERALEAKNDQLEAFTSVVSHDLRNPLNVAEGRLELLREDCDSEHLEPIDRAHERMHTLIDDLLTLAREGEPAGERESVALESLVEDCWSNVATENATILTDTERVVRADASRLQQLIENLLRNAVEHAGDDVTITIGELSDGFYVEDDGSGIPEATRAEVFDAGYSTAREGTGFGLSIVKQVADAHGWDIRVTEGSRGGARFEITGVSFGESVPYD